MKKIRIAAVLVAVLAAMLAAVLVPAPAQAMTAGCTDKSHRYTIYQQPYNGGNKVGYVEWRQHICWGTGGNIKSVSNQTFQGIYSLGTILGYKIDWGYASCLAGCTMPTGATHQEKRVNIYTCAAYICSSPSELALRVHWTAPSRAYTGKVFNTYGWMWTCLNSVCSSYGPSLK